MISKLKTVFAFTTTLLTTGAFSETSEQVEKEVTKYVVDDDDFIVVEFGMGHGNITKQILSKLGKNGKLFAFEVNTKFCQLVDKTIDDKRLTIVNDSAANILKYIDKPIGAVISTIPFSFLSKTEIKKVLEDSYSLLKADHHFSQALYTKHNIKKFEKVYDICELVYLGGVPSEYVFHCKKKALSGTN
jgi:phospholipid N-methyltransferase